MPLHEVTAVGPGQVVLETTKSGLAPNALTVTGFGASNVKGWAGLLAPTAMPPKLNQFGVIARRICDAAGVAPITPIATAITTPAADSCNWNPPTVGRHLAVWRRNPADVAALKADLGSCPSPGLVQAADTFGSSLKVS